MNSFTGTSRPRATEQNGSKITPKVVLGVQGESHPSKSFRLIGRILLTLSGYWSCIIDNKYDGTFFILLLQDLPN